MAFSRDSRLVAVPPGRIFDLATGKEIETSPVYGGDTPMSLDLAFHPNGGMLLGMTGGMSSSPTANKFVARQIPDRPEWRLSGWDRILRERGYASRVLVPPHGNRLLICGGNDVLIYEVDKDGKTTKRSETRIPGTSRYLSFQLVWSDDGDSYAIYSSRSGGTGGIRGTTALQVFSAHATEPRLTIFPRQLNIKEPSAIALSPDGARLALSRRKLGKVEIREVYESRESNN